MQGLVQPLQATLGFLAASRGPVEGLLGHLRALWGLLGAVLLGPSWRHRGGQQEPYWAVFGACWALFVVVVAAAAVVADAVVVAAVDEC
eukprot:156368-Pyramimonas_sp.AAC.1